MRAERQREQQNWTLWSRKLPKRALAVVNTLPDCLVIAQAQADGNCFFHAFGKGLQRAGIKRRTPNHKAQRGEVVQVYRSTVGKKLAKLWDGRDCQNGPCATWEQHTTHMATNATWVGPLEFCALAAKLDVKVVVVSASAGIRTFAYHLTGTSTMMLWCAGSHFGLVVPKKGKVLHEDILNVTTQLPNFTNCRGVGHTTVSRISTSSP